MLSILILLSCIPLIIDFKQRLWVEYDNNKYKVISVNNINQADNFIRLRTIETGDKNITANLR